MRQSAVEIRATSSMGLSTDVGLMMIPVRVRDFQPSKPAVPPDGARAWGSSSEVCSRVGLADGRAGFGIAGVQPLSKSFVEAGGRALEFFVERLNLRSTD